MKSILFIACFISLLFVENGVSQDTIVIRPGPAGKDSQITDIFPDNPHENTEVFKSMAWTHSGVPGLNRAMIEWDLSFLSPETTVLDARLNLYFGTFEPTYVGHTGENASYLLRIIEPWEEAAVTWNNQPLTTMENAVILPQSTSPEQDYTDIDITGLIQIMVSNPEGNHGLMLQLVTEQYYRCLMFSSGDCEDPEKWPSLEIIYSDCQTPVSEFAYTSDEFNAYFQDSSMFAEDYYWDFGDGYFSDLVNPWHQYAAEGTYEVCLTVSNSCWTDTECKWVEICEKPETGFTYQIEAMTAYFEDQSYKAESYYWDFGDGYYSDLPDPFHIYDLPGSYQVCLITWNECGSDTLCQVLDVMSKSYNKGNAGLLSVYPNPGKEKVFVKATADGQAEIGLYDLNGNEISKQQYTLVKDEQVSVDIQTLDPGMYMVRLISGEGSSFGKLVVQ